MPYARLVWEGKPFCLTPGGGAPHTKALLQVAPDRQVSVQIQPLPGLWAQGRHAAANPTAAALRLGCTAKPRKQRPDLSCATERGATHRVWPHFPALPLMTPAVHGCTPTQENQRSSQTLVQGPREVPIPPHTKARSSLCRTQGCLLCSRGPLRGAQLLCSCQDTCGSLHGAVCSASIRSHWRSVPEAAVKLQIC
jgi:hypothetical protein